MLLHASSFINGGPFNTKHASRVRVWGDHHKHARRRLSMQAIIVWGDIGGPIIIYLTKHASNERLGWHSWCSILTLVCSWCKKCKVLLLGLVHVMLHASSFINCGPAFSHHHQACKGARLWTYGEHTTNTHHPQAQHSRASPSNFALSLLPLPVPITSLPTTPSASSFLYPLPSSAMICSPCTIMRTLCSVF